MERSDLYEDDLTEERYPSPVKRDKEAASERIDPDADDDDDDEDDDDDDDDDEDDDVDVDGAP
jgi:hypothetical protein